ncbi:hypothetical protein ACFQ48_18170 [Hymenobacter caeli]|uniref:DUF4488 domain-containing protein n=1 Tax=Hymenobacter caeli TaxID=2735894 RepID=A0ABX2FUL0_9BACT|nr:hypothetical protein [Hymenobacter caeli]NRT20866.1 hypothetical protein [Hymenobacter caeli]
MKFGTLMLFLFVGSTGITGCQPNQSPFASRTSKPAATTDLQRLTGVWVRQDTSGEYKGGFQLMRINADSTGTFAFFSDNAKTSGKAFFIQHPEAPRYYFKEGPIKVRYRPKPPGKLIYIPDIEVQVWTSGFRFDYELSGDTLREIDKMGYQGSLVRVQRGVVSKTR